MNRTNLTDQPTVQLEIPVGPADVWFMHGLWYWDKPRRAC